MFCPFCGTDNASDQKYCRNCGASLPTNTAKLSNTKAHAPVIPSAPITQGNPAVQSSTAKPSGSFIPPSPPNLPNRSSKVLSGTPEAPVVEPVIPDSSAKAGESTSAEDPFATQLAYQVPDLMKLMSSQPAIEPPPSEPVASEPAATDDLVDNFYETKVSFKSGFGSKESYNDESRSTPPQSDISTIEMSAISPASDLESFVSESSVPTIITPQAPASHEERMRMLKDMMDNTNMESWKVPPPPPPPPSSLGVDKTISMAAASPNGGATTGESLLNSAKPSSAKEEPAKGQPPAPKAASILAEDDLALDSVAETLTMKVMSGVGKASQDEFSYPNMEQASVSAAKTASKAPKAQEISAPPDLSETISSTNRWGVPTEFSEEIDDEDGARTMALTGPPKFGSSGAAPFNGAAIVDTPPVSTASPGEEVFDTIALPQAVVPANLPTMPLPEELKALSEQANNAIKANTPAPPPVAPPLATPPVVKPPMPPPVSSNAPVTNKPAVAAPPPSNNASPVNTPPVIDKKPVKAKSSTTFVVVAIAAGVFLVIAVIAVKLVLFPTKPKVDVKNNPVTTPTPVASTTPVIAKTPTPVASPIVTAPPNMVLVPAGEYTIGCDDSQPNCKDGPEHKVTLKAFYLDVYEVTNEDYEKFVKDVKYPAPLDWKDGQYPGDAKAPVGNVSWEGAKAYAKWAGKRLPTQEEWEAAASGKDHYALPWAKEAGFSASGDLRVKVEKNKERRITTTVGSEEKNKSPFGAYDMIGSVWEWTSSLGADYPGAKVALTPTEKKGIVIKGCSSLDNRPNDPKEKIDSCSIAYREFAPIDAKAPEIGFRCAKDATPSGKGLDETTSENSKTPEASK